MGLVPLMVFLLCSSLVVVQQTNGAAVDHEGGHGIHKRQSFGTTNNEIGTSLRHIMKAIRGLENKLSRHEFREAQVADYSTKALNGITADQILTQKNMQAVARQLLKTEEMILALEQLVKTIDERQRHQFSELTENVLKMSVQSAIPPPPMLPPRPGGGINVGIEVKKVLRKAIAIDATLKKNLKRIDNEIQIVGDSMNKHLTQLSEQQNTIQTEAQMCKKGHMETLDEIVSNLQETGQQFSFEVGESKKLMQKGGGVSGGCSEVSGRLEQEFKSLRMSNDKQENELTTMNEDISNALNDQKRDLQLLIDEVTNGRENQEESLERLLNNQNGAVKNLNELKDNSKSQLENLEGVIKGVLDESVHVLNTAIEEASNIIKVDTMSIQNALEDTASQSENIQASIGEHFDDLTIEIRSLKKVEQVMLNTADAVLDTKRSIEFGIKQVILELSEIVRNSGKNINSTLADQINTISFNILKNQTSALTNMTKKMEQEISQVWRQIGIMYQEVSTSVHLLDEIQTSTNLANNASRKQAGEMDGTVGQITQKVEGVEDNLNYLLGRLSLVVSEFSQMKTGIGYELEKLREMAKEFSQKDMTEYTVENEVKLQK